MARGFRLSPVSLMEGWWKRINLHKSIPFWNSLASRRMVRGYSQILSELIQLMSKCWKWLYDYLWRIYSDMSSPVSPFLPWKTLIRFWSLPSSILIISFFKLQIKLNTNNVMLVIYYWSKICLEWAIRLWNVKLVIWRWKCLRWW